MELIEKIEMIVIKIIYNEMFPIELGLLPDIFYKEREKRMINFYKINEGFQAKVKEAMRMFKDVID